MSFILLAFVFAVLAAASYVASLWFGEKSRAPILSPDAFRASYRAPSAPVRPPEAIYHLGHSLVGHDMPHMFATVGRHRWAAQLGWGASLKNHLQNHVPGHAEENGGPHFLPALAAAEAGRHDVFVLTEMVSLRDAIRYHDSAAALAEWVRRIRAGNPLARVYLYETWHALGAGEASVEEWLRRIDHDLPALWEGELLRPAMAQAEVGLIHVIPGGQVLAALTRAAQRGDIPGVTGHRDFLSDDIHLAPLGAWAIAMTHYAVIYARSPEGLPHRLPAEDGTLSGAPSEAAARIMQRLIWQVVTRYPPTGVEQTPPPSGGT